MELQNTSQKNNVILVVDDQPNNLKVVASVLSDIYTLSFANNGPTALKMLEKGTPDLILLDIMMPEMDGFDVCEKIKANPKTKNIPIIFLTAKTDIADIIKGFETGAVDYITKPFNPTEVKVRVKNHLALYNAKQEIQAMNKKLADTAGKLKISNIALEKSNQEKDKFFSIIAHDLKNPMAAMLLGGDMLYSMYDAFDDVKRKQHIGMLWDSSKQVSKLLENLLEWARSQTGTMEFKPKMQNFAPIVSINIDLLQYNAESKGIKISNRLDNSYEAKFDSNMITTVLRNLISNAIKYTPKNGEINISAKENENYVTICVADNGVGMRPDVLAKLFKLDSKQSIPGTENERGTGLGLLLCKEFVEKNGGKIWAESQEGKGSQFYFTLQKE